MRIWEIDGSKDHVKRISVRFPSDADEDEIRTVISALRGIATDLGDFEATEDITDKDTGKKKGAIFPFEKTETAKDFVRRVTKQLSDVKIEQKSADKLKVNE